jgi:hypothetical protein
MRDEDFQTGLQGVLVHSASTGRAVEDTPAALTRKALALDENIWVATPTTDRFSAGRGSISQRFTVRGMIKDSQGQPIAGVSVRAFDKDLPSLKSDEFVGDAVQTRLHREWVAHTHLSYMNDSGPAIRVPDAAQGKTWR